METLKETRPAAPPAGREAVAACRPLAPADGAAVDATAATFTWVDAPGAAGYRMQIAEDDAFRKLRFDEEIGPATQLTLHGLLPEEAGLWWRVRATDEAAWSEAARFTTAREALPAPAARPAGASPPRVASMPAARPVPAGEARPAPAYDAAAGASAPLFLSALVISFLAVIATLYVLVGRM